jgi:F420-dependent oxidoreductase-like protein
MTQTIGVAVQAPDAGAVVAMIERLEKLGIPAAWLTTGGAGLDGLTLFAAAALRTERILLGTCIVPTFPRHPIVMVQQAQVVAQLAPNRFRLGIGPSHKPTIERMFGIDFERPLSHLAEYLTVVKDLLHRGEVDHQGERFRVQARLARPAPVPVMISALRPGSYALAGALADGAISWVSPYAYLRERALAALKRGAEEAGRPVPPLIAHTPVVVHEDCAAVRAAALQQIATYPRTPFYQRMFTAAGYPEAQQGSWSEAMLDAVVISGDETTVAQRLRDVLSFAGEVIVSVITVGEDREASRTRTLNLLADLARRLASERGEAGA